MELENQLISVNAVYTGATEITGVCVSGENYRVFASNNNVIIGEQETVKEDGSYILTIPPQLKGQMITIYLYNIENGGVFEASISIIVTEEGGPAKITYVDSYSISSDPDRRITGTYTGVAAKVFLTIDGVDTPIVDVNPGGGRFQYLLRTFQLTESSKVSISITDSEKVVLDTATVIILP